MIHFAEPGWSATFSHFKMAQKTKAVNKLERVNLSFHRTEPK